MTLVSKQSAFISRSVLCAGLCYTIAKYRAPSVPVGNVANQSASSKYFRRDFALLKLSFTVSGNPLVSDQKICVGNTLIRSVEIPVKRRR